jgi:succinate-semialdehyde dehydrogenase / glutarate-semialdehyde dehydrogenase
MDILTKFQNELYIDGHFVESASQKTFNVYNPADNKLLATVASAGQEDVVNTVNAADQAFSLWRNESPRSRSVILRNCYDIMVENKENIATLISLEEGKTRNESRGEVDYAAEFFRWFSEEAVRVNGELSRSPAGNNNILVVNDPVGVCFLVTPWNFPAAMMTRKIAPALAAGCSVILKPSEETPLTALYLAKLFTQAGVPNGVINILPSDEPEEVSEAIFSDKRIRKISFTGSTAIGSHLLNKASKKITNCSMELGGNAPFIVLDDADIDTAVTSAMIAKMRNAGESCIAANRFYIHESLADTFSEKITHEMLALQIGNGLEVNTDVGPLINIKAVNKIHQLVLDAVDKGATLLCGGELLNDESCFYPPTVLKNVPVNAHISHQEIFGPVIAMSTFSDINEIVNQANDTEFGLAAYIMSKNIQQALNLASSLEAGVIGINQGFVSDPAAPFGGVKQSGLGREGGSDGIWEFIEKKYIAVDW